MRDLYSPLGGATYRRRFVAVMSAAEAQGWRVWIAPSSHEATGGYVVHARGPISGREHHKYLPEAVVAAKRWLTADRDHTATPEGGRDA